MERQELSIMMVGMQRGTATREDIWQFHTNINIPVPYDPGIVLFVIHQKVLKIHKLKP